MSRSVYRIVRWGSGYRTEGFDCGSDRYNDWLTQHAAASVRAGVCAVYLLIEEIDDRRRVVGYFAISPAQVAREIMPAGMARGSPRTVPAWRLGKLAVHVDLQADKQAQWGRQLLREALQTIVRIAEAGGGKVVVVDADNAGLLGFYTGNGFARTGLEEDLTLFLKISTARAALGGGQP